MAISLSFSSAIEFQLSSPESVAQNEEFKVSITANESDNYDVKIYVEDPNSKPKTISEIYNGNEWQNSYFYIVNALPANSEFKLKIIKAGEWDICARLRKDSPTKPVCNNISVAPSVEQSQNEEQQEPNPNESPKEEQSSTNENNNNEAQESKKEQNANISTGNAKEKINLSYQSGSSNNSPPEKIVLNSKPKNVIAKQDETFITKTEKLRLSLIFSFISLCVVIIILFAIRRL